LTNPMQVCAIARRWALAFVLFGAFFAHWAVASPAASVQEETIRIAGPIQGLKLGLRHASMANTALHNARTAVLFLHGAGVPTSGNPDFRQGGRSFMSVLAERGFDVWALDFYGFGESDRYPEMADSPDKHLPLGPAPECAQQVQSVVTFLKQERHVQQVLLIGDSGGSIIAGLFAAEHADSVARLVLFGPITPFSDGPSPQDVLPAFALLTPIMVWNLLKSQAETAGAPDVLDSSIYQGWADTYLRSDPSSATRNPPSVRVPNGRQADLANIARGHYTFDPSEIRAPTLIVMGETDEIATFEGAKWLLKSLQHAASRRLVVLGHASHTVQFETERGTLYRVVADFLSETD